MMQLTAFFDESGHPRDPKAKMFGMSCCFAPAKVWVALDYGESHLQKLVARARQKAKELAQARKLQNG